VSAKAPPQAPAYLESTNHPDQLAMASAAVIDAYQKNMHPRAIK